MISQRPDKSPEPIAVGRFSSAFAVHGFTSGVAEPFSLAA